MVWSISQNQCLSKVKLDYSIISIGFHPEGNVIAVASGIKLELWDWTKNLNFSRSGYNLAPSTAAPPISHVRNIRAVMFHPDGDYLLAAAPDAPRQSTETVTYCSLFAINVANWLQLNHQTHLQEDERSPLKLTNHILVLPQIHLYSDGGIDITKDGNHLITCSRLFFPPRQPVHSQFNNRTNAKIGLSPLSTTERMEEDETTNDSMTLSSIGTTSLDISQLNHFRLASFPPVFENNSAPFKLKYLDDSLGNLGQAAALSNDKFSFSSHRKFLFFANRSALQEHQDEDSINHYPTKFPREMSSMVFPPVQVLAICITLYVIDI